MSEIRIAERYARSLVMLAGDQGRQKEVYADMRQFSDICSSSRDLTGMLKSPIISADRKIAVLQRLFGDGFDALSMLFFRTVVKKGRESFLPLIAKEFIRQYNELNNIAKATVTTAVALDELSYAEIRKDLEQKTGKHIELQTAVDPSLIGGLVVRMGDNLYDASIARKLKKIKIELVLN
jgi:F-type H+-transporting ATPase subunit delta